MAEQLRTINDQQYRVISTSQRPELGFELYQLQSIDPVEVIRQDACIVRIVPGGRSPIFMVKDREVVLTDTLVRGKGLLLVSSPENGPLTRRVNSDLELPTFEYRHRDQFVWLAGKRTPLVIFGTNTPPYNESQEVEVPLRFASPRFVDAILRFRPQEVTEFPNLFKTTLLRIYC